MSKLYATIIADRGHNKHRCSTNNIHVSAQSWDGSISVLMNKDGDVSIRVGGGATTFGRDILNTNIKNLLNCNNLEVV